MCIVIVDDNPTNLLIIEQILKKAGYTSPVKLSSALELFDYLQLQSEIAAEPAVDLILMDMMMPEVDGIEACRTIQRVDRLKDIPIIIVTAIGDSMKLAEALDAGAIDYVTKPINKVELLARIRVALRLKYENDWHKERDQRIRNELALAKQVQSSVLSLPISSAVIDIAAEYRPSFELAGDLYAWYKIDKHRYGIMLLDMMGHGISSSLVCMFISSKMKETILQLIEPEAVMTELNRHMNQLSIKDLLIQYYFTAIYMVVDTRNQTIEYVNAGHPPGFMFTKRRQPIPLDKGSCAIGLFPEITVSKQLLSYEGGEQIILYTDGLAEQLNGEVGSLLSELGGRLSSAERLSMERLTGEFMPQESEDQKDDMCLVLIDLKTGRNGKST